MEMEVSLDAGYIKAGRLAAESVTVSDMKPLVLAFIGWDEELTRRYFRQFAQDNAEQIYQADFNRGVLRFLDGSIVRRISPARARALDGYRFDQIILADDTRLYLVYFRLQELCEMNCRCLHSDVPEEFRFIYYNTDDPKPTIYASMRGDAGPTPVEAFVYGRATV